MPTTRLEAGFVPCGKANGTSANRQNYPYHTDELGELTGDK